MRKLTAKIILPIAVIMAIVSAPIILPLQASADINNGFTTTVDNSTLNYDNPNRQSGSNPYKISLSGIVTSGMLMNVVGCTGIVNKVSKISTQFISDLLLRKTERLARKAIKKSADAADKIVDAAQKAVMLGAQTPSGIFTSEQGIKIQNYAKSIADTSNKVAKSVKELVTDDDIDSAMKRLEDKAKEANFREECINGIAVQLAKNQLTSMTKYTMNWINSGFNGDPLFVQNVNSFMNSLTDEITKEELSWFKDPKNASDYPYGRDYARSAINSVQSAKNFQDSMKQDLTNYLEPGATPESFARDFSQGGWDGWHALTQHSQNNPLGFIINESENLEKKKSEAVQNTTNELNRNGGVLDQRKCVEYEKNTSTAFGGRDLSINALGKSAAKCIKYATVTPGSVIKTKIDTYVNSPERQLELAKTLNDALNALFSALINKFENQGLSGLKPGTNNYTGTGGGFGINQIFDENGNSLTGGTGGSTGGGFNTTGFFDLTRDLGNTYTGASTNNNWIIDRKGVLQIQHDYMNLVNKSKEVIDRVLPELGKLDYCIPGPNPAWKNYTADSINAYLDTLDNTNNPPAIDPSAIQEDLNAYEIEVDNLYGGDSAMQDANSGTSYLKMSQDGLTLTRDIGTYADTIKEAKGEYASAISDGNANIIKLNSIKDKVNAIIVAAQKRRATKRAGAGLSAVKAMCLTSEKVTYLDTNGDIK